VPPDGGAPPQGCLIQTGGTCRDNHIYSAECQGDPTSVSSCACKVDGNPTKNVNSTCEGAPAACAFPSSQ
jgi:hypothetical protein